MTTPTTQELLARRERLLGAGIATFYDDPVHIVRDAAVSLIPLFLLIRRLVSISWRWDRPELGRRKGLEAYIEDACQRVDAFSF